MYIVVLLALLALVVVLAGLPLWRPAGGLAAAGGDGAGPDPAGAGWEAGQAAEQETEREKVLAALAEAEYDFHMNKLSEADYQELKARHTRLAMELLRADVAPEPTADPLDPEAAARLEAAAEAAVAAAAGAAAAGRDPAEGGGPA